jgi:hypothetical protein
MMVMMDDDSDDHYDLEEVNYNLLLYSARR